MYSDAELCLHCLTKIYMHGAQVVTNTQGVWCFDKILVYFRKLPESAGISNSNVSEDYEPQ
jgi:hypothetical protein